MNGKLGNAELLLGVKEQTRDADGFCKVWPNTIEHVFLEDFKGKGCSLELRGRWQVKYTNISKQQKH